MGHASTRRNGDHEARKQLYCRRASSSRLPAVGYSMGPSQFRLWLCASPRSCGGYKDGTGNGGSRNNFDDAIMFIGWYTAGTHKQLGISKWDTYNQYLAYHEGRGGYRRGSHRSKPWLMQVARNPKTTTRSSSSAVKS